MSAPQAADVLGRVVLLTGKEEYLAQRTVVAIKQAVRAYDAEAEVSDLPAGDLAPSSMGELTAPSLFSATRCVIVRELENLPEDSQQAVLDFAGAPADDVALVLIHSGGTRGTGLLTKLRKLASVTEHKTAEVRPSELPGFVAGEFRARGGAIDPEAASYLIAAVGQDLRALAGAVDQLTSDFDGQRLGVAEVKRYFGGRAEAKSFAVADAAFSGRQAKALEELRWALEGGTAPVLITSACAGSARSIARYLGAPRGLREADLARELGVPPWKVRTVRDQSRAWQPRAIGAAIRAVADADAGIKGAESDAEYTLERLVLQVCALRSS